MKDNKKKELLKVNNLKTYFYTHEGIIKAVDAVSFSVNQGETRGFVGESGSGKSVTALSIMR
ncbi:MAG: peptide/nickel transport system ATP-binding protein, partial [Candidatus Atribacteria bacterium]|nr:peptide/nickel transport system ATP-binding protein [Candidatus Atribacteria bacterium]